jgi:3-deoxy-D-manno-octulosonic-acid transferase
MLHCFNHLFVQSAASEKLLSRIGISGNVSISGDTRFDRVIGIAATAEALPQPIIDFCGTQPVLVAGSTWPEDEEELDHYANRHPEIKFIIAPHEIDEAHLKEIEKLFQRTVRYAALNAVNDTGNINVLIIDNIGLLSRLYCCATVTYVGGGFGADGIHNVLEPAVFGKPVIFGPEHEKYIEAIELIEAGGAVSIDNALELEKVLDELFDTAEGGTEIPDGNAAKEYVYSKAGASKKIMDHIQVKRLLMS